MSQRKLLTERSGLAFRANFTVLSEDTKKEIADTGSMIVRGVPATILDEKNLNGRIYPESVMRSAIQEAHDEGAFSSKRLICTADDHPETSYPKPSDSSHVVIDSYIREIGGRKILFNDWLILNTSKGKDLQALFKDGVSIGTSIRGLGRLNENDNKIEDYQYLGTDAVGQPSAGTYVNPEELKVSESLVIVESVKNIHDIKEKFNNKSIKNMSNLSKLVAELRATKDVKEQVKKIIAIEKAAITSGEKLPAEFAKLKESVFAKIAIKEEADELEGDKDVATDKSQEGEPELKSEEDEDSEDKKDDEDKDSTVTEDDEVSADNTDEEDKDEKDDEKAMEEEGDELEGDKTVKTNPSEEDKAKTEAKSSKKLKEQAKDVINKAKRQNESLEDIVIKAIEKNLTLEAKLAKATAVSEKLLKSGVYTKEEMNKAVENAIEAGVKSVSEMAEYVHDIVQERATGAIANLLESLDEVTKENSVMRKTFSKGFKFQSSIIEALVNKCKEIVERDSKAFEYSRTVESKVDSKIGTDINSKLFTGYKY